jgi:hypothetical protein
MIRISTENKEHADVRGRTFNTTFFFHNQSELCDQSAQNSREISSTILNNVLTASI